MYFESLMASAVADAAPLLHMLGWSLLTIGIYALAKQIHRRWPVPWLMPLASAPVMIAVVLLMLHGSYRDYIGGTHWLVALLGPATVAFAIPIYRQRMLIRQYWPVLLAGMVAGSATAIMSSWTLASLAGLNDTVRLSLLPRSMSTPFAMSFSSELGGSPNLTAVFVILTGVIGAVMGDVVLHRFEGGSALARGAMFGMGAHGAGTAQAQRFGETEGAVAGLVMVLVGIMNLLLAPVLIRLTGL